MQIFILLIVFMLTNLSSINSSTELNLTKSKKQKNKDIFNKLFNKNISQSKELVLFNQEKNMRCSR